MKKRQLDMYRLGTIRAIYAQEDGTFGQLHGDTDIDARNAELANAYLAGYKRGLTLRHVN